MALETFLAKTPRKEYAKLQDNDDVELQDVIKDGQSNEETPKEYDEIKGNI
jgi:hypothetical protein